ncbi:MAG TPA: sodium:solute symporter [Flavobacteriaceae bacterium]|jgi:Na+/proline symporter|nr:sodium:solute symporter [Flavobacteriaceae bacterium]MAY54191.1 sodium:solute symporter [Flavobacteriaceae bacterium]HBR55722.1 sodium:solute symporter [Flavobacteriaceae bacterium]HIB48685.1 sodium:solute symporter [Flavobacteriaceae bacterium]HIN98243.1 sodium:solute symporter [Flavobacteriaceae bacterium]|tara:strand:- start:824 stop:2287 length:1464 start_codon:yes stop_codon:yes gene_type:complete
MQPLHILLLIGGYFGILLLVSYFTNRGGSNDDFFKAGKQSPWYLVAFGMIGASLSGVTFISVPGAVEATSFSYFQVVLGYTVGYAVIGLVLLPLYYRLNLTSIYTYLDGRFGNASYKTGASFFLLSRVVGASFRLYLVAIVLQDLVFDKMPFFGQEGVPFWVTVTITILLIWLYTFKSGIKTIVWTDTLQTLFMLIALGVGIYYVSEGLGISGSGILTTISESDLSQIFFFEDYKSGQYFIKQFISGAFIAIVMTGLDQDMMQKNLTCRNLKDAQKNMFWFTLVLTVVNIIFLGLGLLLTLYAQQNGIDAEKDKLFSTIAVDSGLGIGLAVFFLLGLIAAAYSSADSALTSLTTSFSIDILDIEKKHSKKDQVKIRKRVHIGMSLLLIFVIIFFNYAIGDTSVILKLFTFAGYTYGPLLGLYAFGLFSNWKVKDKWVPLVAILTPFVGYAISYFSELWFGFEFGFFILILNGLLTYIGLVLVRAQQN